MNIDRIIGALNENEDVVMTCVPVSEGGGGEPMASFSVTGPERLVALFAAWVCEIEPDGTIAGQ